MKKGVLVTGADGGLGLSLVKRFLQGGYVVFAGVHRSAVDLNGLAGEYGNSLALTARQLDSALAYKSFQSIW